MFELRHLRYFVALAEELHFSRAAEKLGIATPTLSAQIRVLESDVGARLFVRRTREVGLTKVGERFLESARSTLREAEQAALVARQAARGETGSIAIGFVLSAACSGLVQGAVKRFRAGHPEVTFNLRRIETFLQMKELVDGRIDVGFMRAASRYPEGLTGEIIERQSFTLALPDDHPLASVTAIQPSMLAGQAFVGPPLEVEVGFWRNINAVTGGLPVNIVARAPDALSVLTMVAAGIGLGVFSDGINRVQLPGVVFHEISGAPSEGDQAIVYRKNEGAAVIKAFTSFVRAAGRCQGAS